MCLASGSVVTAGPLAKVFTASAIADLAGPRSYARGVSYHRDGRAESPTALGSVLQATVRGTVPYTVKLWVDGDRPGWSCTCPAAEDGSFCKHCVAVAITLDPDAGRSAALSLVPERDSAPSPPPDLELPDFVGQLPKDRLVEIVLQQTTSDWRLRERLLADARAVRGEGPDLAAWQRRIARAFAPHSGGVVSYREAEGWAAGIQEEIDALDDVCEAGHPDAVVSLAEYAYGRADKAAEYVDDSDGWLSDISEQLAGLHYRACSEGRPDRAELASRLVELEFSSNLDGFYRAAADYAEILGEVGLAAYREHLDHRRAEMEARRGHDPTSDYVLDQVREAQVSWALGVGDPDTLIDTIIEVRRGERIYPGDVRQIIRALTSAGRVDEAIDWARRELHANRGPFGHAAYLRDYLAGSLRERGDMAAAVELFWDAFSEDTSLATYRRLLQEAGEDPRVEGGWAQRCVEELRARLAEPVAETDWRGRRIVASAGEALLEILLYEGRFDEAWHAATEFGCDQQMWHTLARAREHTHPLDAIAIYEPEVISQIERVKTPAYRTAVDLMERIRRLADAVDEPNRFTDLLERVRTEHWRKRNLRKLLDDRGW